MQPTYGLVHNRRAPCDAEQPGRAAAPPLQRLHAASEWLRQDVGLEVGPTSVGRGLIFDDHIEQVRGDVIVSRITPLEQHLGLFPVRKHPRGAVVEEHVQPIPPRVLAAAWCQEELNVAAISSDVAAALGVAQSALIIYFHLWRGESLSHTFRQS